MEALAEQRRRLMAWPHLRSSVAVVGLLVWMLLLSSVLTVAIVLPIVNPPSIPHYDSVPPQWADDPTVLHQLAPSETTYEHWDVVLRKGKIVAVAPLEEKGEDRIFRAQLVVGEEEKQDGGSGGETYEVVVRMSMHEDEASAEEKRDTRDLTTLKTSKRDGMRAQPAIRGWSDVVAYHSDCVLGLGRALPAVGRRLSNRQLYASATSAAADEIRNRDVFAVPVALVPWVEKGSALSAEKWAIAASLIDMNASLPLDEDSLELMRITSDTIIFDFLLANNERYNASEWRSGAVLCGPAPMRRCEGVECNTDSSCRTICRFPAEHCESLQEIRHAPKGNRFSDRLQQRLNRDPCAPEFDLGVFYFKEGRRDRDDNIVHLEVANFYQGIDSRVKEVVKLVDQCMEAHGEEAVLI